MCLKQKVIKLKTQTRSIWSSEFENHWISPGWFLYMSSRGVDSMIGRSHVVLIPAESNQKHCYECYFLSAGPSFKSRQSHDWQSNTNSSLWYRHLNQCFPSHTLEVKELRGDWLTLSLPKCILFKAIENVNLGMLRTIGNILDDITLY